MIEQIGILYAVVIIIIIIIIITLVTCEINYFTITSAFVNVCLKYFFSASGNLPAIISQLFHRLIAAREYSPTCSVSLK